MRPLILFLGWTVISIFSSSCSENINPPIVEDQEFFVDENTPAGSIVGVVIAYDMDEGQTGFFQTQRWR